MIDLKIKWILVGILAMMLTQVSNTRVSAGQSGSIGHDDVLLGMHFVDSDGDRQARGLNGGDPIGVVPGFPDYVKYMPEDLKHMSYADFWYWWFSLERYKGDEKGLGELDALVEQCMDRGMKVKIDLAYSSWWTADLDWETDMDLVRGPANVDDWVHLCDLLGRRYRGKIALWLLQGESNQLDAYWKNKPIEHAQEVFKKGYTAFKRVDPDVKISVSGAAQCMPREGLENWYRANIKACKGYYDDIPMNFFADVPGGDEFHGLVNYYNAIRGMMDKVGEHNAEIGSGESCVQWLLDSYKVPDGPPPTSMDGVDPAGIPFCEMKQAWRLNESLGTYYGAGGNKFMWWGTEFAPGGGWSWRWGFRKYQDWWGIWPDANKVPGTNIVYRYDNPDGRKADIRRGWSSSETDPYHPVWEVFKYWAQAAPPGGESIRVPAEVSATGGRCLHLATYLRTEDRCVVLMQNDKPVPTRLSLDLSKIGWPKDTAVVVSCKSESIDYATGSHTPGTDKSLDAVMAGDSLRLELPAMSSFTTLDIRRKSPALDARYVQQILSKECAVGEPIEGSVIVRNSGASPWSSKDLALAVYAGSRRAVGQLSHDVLPGETAIIPVKLPRSEMPGYTTQSLRLRCGRDAWFGPTYSFSAAVQDADAPRKLVAFREVGHVRLKWFAPVSGHPVREYEIQRAEGFGMPFTTLVRMAGDEYIDTDLTKDTAYYYRVVAIDQAGRPSRPSNEDNASAIAKARFYDAEIVSHSVPAQMRQGASATIAIEIKNTGIRAWDLGQGKHPRFRLQTTQQWGIQDEGVLPCIELGEPRTVKPGDTVSLTIPFSAPKAGRFENHWVMSMDVAGKGRAYFGTPILAETVVSVK